MKKLKKLLKKNSDGSGTVRINLGDYMELQAADIRQAEKINKIVNKYSDKIAEALLKDLDYDVTNKGKEYIKKYFEW